MKIIVYMTETKREAALIAQVIAGFKKHGEEVDTQFVKSYKGIDPQYDLCVFVGVRRKSMRIHNAAKAINQNTLMIDKGYFRRDSYHRFSVNSPQPLYLREMDYPVDRVQSMGISVRYTARAKGANKVIYAGASDKYSVFHGLGPMDQPYPANGYADEVCTRLLQILKANNRTDLKVVYRPQPSWWQRLEDRRVPSGTEFSGPDESLSSLLPSTYCLVTHGSNAGTEAAIRGVPVITTGGPEACPIHDLVNTSLTHVLSPRVPTERQLEHRLAQMAWCQFNEQEMSSGWAWELLKPRATRAERVQAVAEAVPAEHPVPVPPQVATGL